MRDTILVTGGAGFIGSHTCKALSRAGYLPIVYDNLSNGVREAVKWGPLEIDDLENKSRLTEVMALYQPAGVIHFAAHIDSAESTQNAAKFYKNNVANSIALIDAMLRNKVKNIVFSSSAAVYGDPNTIPISENHTLNPVTPYGHSKKIVEQIIKDISTSSDIRYSILRYFNAAGSDPDGQLTENHKPETHLLPLILQSAIDSRKKVKIYGTDYSTPDGTCVRDYIHVSDLADAHVLAMQRLLNHGPNIILNLGTGIGHTVLEVIREVEVITGSKIHTIFAKRRAGDVAILVADPQKSARLLKWKPQYKSIRQMITHMLVANSTKEISQ